MFHDICNILVYFHQLAGEPNWHIFGYPVLIFLLKKLINVICLVKKQMEIITKRCLALSDHTKFL